MQDRFKSRYWGKKSKQYLTNICKRDDGSLFALEKLDTCDGYITLEIDRNDVEEEYCLGLEDKNGKLIYEGDFINITGTAINTTTGVTVRCDVEGRTIKWVCNGFEQSLSVNRANYDWYEMPDLEIISNVRENPELLKEKNNE